MAKVNIVNSLTDQKIVDCLNSGGIVVARTDTLYGVLAKADDERAVARVYALKDRSEHKSPIVLISDLDQLYESGSETVKELMAENWPGPVSIVVPTLNAPQWLQRDNGSVAFRMPAHDGLRSLVRATGPLIAPSANPEAHEPALSVEEACDYFGDQVDIYVDGGRVYEDTPSKLLRVDDHGNVERLR